MQAPGGGLEGRFLELEVVPGDSYPAEPPRIRFLSRVNLPIVDDAGRVIPSTVRYMNAWTPASSIGGALSAIAEVCARAPPGQPDDGARY